MTTIAAGSQVMTAITFYTVAPERQQELVDLLIRAAKTVRRQSGFISFNVHKSLDKTHVVSYTQWESRQAFDEALQDASVIPFVQAVLKLATFEPHLYEVVAVIHKEVDEERS
jgi:quinol monooxygenase YgiN